MSSRLLNQEFDFWMSIWILAGVMTNYPNAKSSETRIIMDTKKYCKQMQVFLSFYCKRKHS